MLTGAGVCLGTGDGYSSVEGGWDEPRRERDMCSARIRFVPNRQSMCKIVSSDLLRVAQYFGCRCCWSGASWAEKGACSQTGKYPGLATQQFDRPCSRPT